MVVVVVVDGLLGLSMAAGRQGEWEGGNVDLTVKFMFSPAVVEHTAVVMNVVDLIWCETHHVIPLMLTEAKISLTILMISCRQKQSQENI